MTVDTAFTFLCKRHSNLKLSRVISADEFKYTEYIVIDNWNNVIASTVYIEHNDKFVYNRKDLIRLIKIYNILCS
jgi:hypothetical protein